MLPRITRHVRSLTRTTISVTATTNLPKLSYPFNQSQSIRFPTSTFNCFSTTTTTRSSDNAARPNYSVGELSTKEYQTVSDRAMDRLTEYMEELMEETAGQPGGENFDVEYSSGVLTMKVTDTVTYVINKQPPNKQIWLASPISGPKRYDYDSKHKVWFYHRDNSLMRDLLNAELKVLMNNESVDVDLGEEDTGSSFHFTTAEILFAGTVGNRDVLYLYGDVGDTFALDLYSNPSAASSSGPAKFTTTGTTLYFSTPTAGLSVINLPGGGLLIFSDLDTAGTFWNPLINQSGNFANYFNYGTTSTILVGGPYLVRSASISGNLLTLNADLDAGATTPITIIAPSSVTAVKINNGGNLALTYSPLNAYGLLVSSIAPFSTNQNIFPALNNWKYADSLPEISPTFDDSTWAVVKAGALNNPTPPLFGNLWLYACEYGFCEGEVVYRGYFQSTGQTGLKIAVSGGTAAAGSIWLNGHFVGSVFDASPHTFTFPAGSIVSGSNVITVLTDNMGQDEGNQGPKDPRGIIGYALVGGTSDFTTWKIQGKVGGYTNFPDKVRKVPNAGGLFGDRSNWQNSGFDDSSWTPATIPLAYKSAGVGFYRTDFNLALPRGFDYPVYLNIGPLESQANGYRSNIWINGWKFGRFINYLGPQTSFPIPPGIINFDGPNTIAVSLWAVNANGGTIGSLNLSVDAIYSWSFNTIASNNPA